MGKRARNATGPNGAITAATRARDALAVDLRAKRHTFQEIADELGCDTSTAFRAYQRGMLEIRAITSESADLIRAGELRTLDALEYELLQRIQNPQIDKLGLREPIHGPVRAVVAVQERRAKLLGLDAAQQVEVSGPGGGPIQVAVQLDLSALTDDELRQLRQLVAKATPQDTTIDVEGGEYVFDS